LFTVRVAAPVPPLPTGRVPVTPVVKLTDELALANPVPYHQNSYVANPYFPNQRLSY
jgi:hypothetical protein